MTYTIPEEWVDHIKDGEGVEYDNRGNIKTIEDPVKGTNIGYGHSLTYNGGWKKVERIVGQTNKETLTVEQADKLCRADIKEVCDILDRDSTFRDWWRSSSPACQYVLIDMCYTMGIGDKDHGLKSFPNMIGAMKKGNYEEASQHMVDSLYYNQTKRRGARNAEYLRTGEWREFDCVIKNGHPIKDSQGRWKVKDSHTGEVYDYSKHSTCSKGEDMTRQQVKEDTENAKAFGEKKVEQARQASNKAKSAGQKQATAKNNTATKTPEVAENKQAQNTPVARPNGQTRTGNASTNDEARMRNMLNNLNKANRKFGQSKVIDVDKTLDDLKKQYGADASKVLAKAMMAPVTMAKTLDLRDKDGKLLTSSRQVIQKLCEIEDTQQKNNVITMATAARSRNSR